MTFSSWGPVCGLFTRLGVVTHSVGSGGRDDSVAAHPQSAKHAHAQLVEVHRPAGRDSPLVANFLYVSGVAEENRNHELWSDDLSRCDQPGREVVSANTVIEDYEADHTCRGSKRGILRCSRRHCEAREPQRSSLTTSSRSSFGGLVRRNVCRSGVVTVPSIVKTASCDRFFTSVYFRQP